MFLFFKSVIVLHYLTIITLSENLHSLISQIENELKNRSEFLQTQFRIRCTNSCPQSYRSCSTILPKFECSQIFNRTDCHYCFDPGSLINFEESLVSIANEPQNLTQDQEELICSTARIDNFFRDSKRKFPQISWQYIGTHNGLMRSYPAQDECNYDPRIRPWYIGGATGSKNILIIIDISGSMEEDNKLKNAIKAAKVVIDTLSLSDWIGLVYFNSTAYSVGNELVRATKINRNNITETLDTLKLGGGSNFEEAFKLGYKIIANSKGDKLGLVACKTIILFLTDGEPSSGEKNTTKIAEMITQLEEENKANATIISFAFGPSAYPEELKPISCAGNGLTEYVEFQENLSERMLDYYFLLSSGITGREVIWSEPYEDNKGLGNMTTAVFPFYDTYFSDPPLLLGVIAVDITMSELYQYDSAETILQELVSKARNCSRLSLSLCQLEKLRGKYNCFDPKISNCTNKNKNIPICENFPHKAFYEGTEAKDDQEVQYCCGTDYCKLEKNIIILSISGGIILISGLIITFSYLVFWCKKHHSIVQNNDKEMQTVIIYSDVKSSR